MIVRVINANLGKVKNHETEAATWGELRAEVRDMYSGDVKGVIRETNTTLEADTAQLPGEKLTGDEKDYDFSLFFVTAKSKAGASYDSWGFHDLRREVAARGINNNGKTRDQLIADLTSSDRANGSREITEESSSVDIVLQRIEDKIDSVLSWIDSIHSTEVEFEEEDEIEEDELQYAEHLQDII